MTSAQLAAPTLSPARRWAILAVILAADVMDLLDSTITNIAAPTIARDLGGGEALIQWLGASYALALGVLLVIGGRLGDKFGRRRIFLIGLVGFTLASIACGLSLSPEMIIVGRLIQGAFGALLIPQGFGILAATWPRDQIGKAFSSFGPVLGLSAVCGPILAGFLIQADLFGLGWRSMFLINIVLGAGANFLAINLLPRDTGSADTRLDVIGSGLLAGTMLGVLYGLIDGANNGWAGLSLGALAAGVVLFFLFCSRQRTADAPIIEPSLFRNRGFTSGLILGLAVFASVAGLMYVLSLFMQGGLGYSPINAALQLAPMAAGIIVASLASHGLIARLGRLLILAGLIVTLCATAWLFLLITMQGTTVGWAALIAPVFALGLGMGACFGSIYDVTIGDISPHEAGSASGSLSAVQQLSNSIGAAVVTIVYFQVLAASGAARAATTSLLIVGIITLAGCGLVWLLPKRAPTQEH